MQTDISASPWRVWNVWSGLSGRDRPSTSQFRFTNDRGHRIPDQSVQNVRFLQTNRLRLAVPPPGHAGDRRAGHDPAEIPGHVFVDVNVSGDPSTVSTRFGGNVVPGGEIRKREDGDPKGHTDHKGQNNIEVTVDPTSKLLHHHGTPNF